MRASVSARWLEQCFPTVMLAVAFGPPGKWTSIPDPPLVTALVADPSVNTWIHASCGYLSAIIARVRGLVYHIILCVSIREGRDCGMDLDVSYVRYPWISAARGGLWSGTLLGPHAERSVLVVVSLSFGPAPGGRCPSVLSLTMGCLACTQTHLYRRALMHIYESTLTHA